jgi:hypothetical protein
LFQCKCAVIWKTKVIFHCCKTIDVFNLKCSLVYFNLQTNAYFVRLIYKYLKLLPCKCAVIWKTKVIFHCCKTIDVFNLKCSLAYFNLQTNAYFVRLIYKYLKLLPCKCAVIWKTKVIFHCCKTIDVFNRKYCLFWVAIFRSFQCEFVSSKKYTIIGLTIQT